MRKLLVIAFLAIFTVSLTAQDGLQGTWFAGGQMAFKSTKDKGTNLKSTDITALPILGKFITPSVAIGAGIGYIGKETKLDKTKLGSGDVFVFKPLVRKYWNISGGLFFFGQAALPVQIGSHKDPMKDQDGAFLGTIKSNSTSFSLQLSPGFDYVVNSWLTIETSFTILDAGFSSTKPKGGKATTSFGLDANPFNSIGDRTVGELQVGAKFLF